MATLVGASMLPPRAPQRAGAAAPTPVEQASDCPLDAFDWSGPKREVLPGRLREISGLAVLDAGLLLAHDDERGIITLIDAAGGERVGQFSLGPILPRDDFEGIAVLNGRVYLATSGGRLYEAPIGRDGQTVAYRVTETKLGAACELEGLAAEPASGSLLLSCKNVRSRALRGQAVVFQWSPERAEATTWFQAAEAGLAASGRRFRPSAVEVTPGGDVLILSSADRAIAAITPPDRVRCTRRLASRHRQPEGLALLADGTLVVADEGSPARLTYYPPRVR